MSINKSVFNKYDLGKMCENLHIVSIGDDISDYDRQVSFMHKDENLVKIESSNENFNEIILLSEDLYINSSGLSKLVAVRDIISQIIKSFYECKRKGNNDYKSKIIQGLNDLKNCSKNYTVYIPLKFKLANKMLRQKLEIVSFAESETIRDNFETVTLEMIKEKKVDFLKTNIISSSSKNVIQLTEERIENIDDIFIHLSQKSLKVPKKNKYEFLYPYFCAVIPNDSGGYSESIVSGVEGRKNDNYYNIIVDNIRHSPEYLAYLISLEDNYFNGGGSEIENRLFLSLKWLSKAFKEENSSMKIAFSIIALEAIFQNHKNTNQIADRIAILTSKLISDDREEQTKIIKKIKNLYDNRSRIVHGRDLAEFANSDFYYISELISIIISKFYSSKDLEKINTLAELEGYL
ncbi:hypothetical protein BN424_1864 [Carnobacterium maltaromaticum LMA28]|uniref:Uncharacterized protein n=1 Tax=Carnobacterium maltaromaticum LMA28 TaxID=1234679 RepID=R7RU16_CARML|nr:HEPN domain-containing protein [Carnobacterium maltaromaticum]CDF59514.1 hypothetical protein BN424_1864 [Carnobacterium maltaromaticum LMA28]